VSTHNLSVITTSIHYKQIQYSFHFASNSRAHTVSTDLNSYETFVVGEKDNRWGKCVANYDD